MPRSDRKTKRRVVEDIAEFARRKPVVKNSVYKIVFNYLQKAQNQGKINEVTFEKVNAEVRKEYPDSKFNPFHLAHYKHKFLIELP